MENKEKPKRSKYPYEYCDVCRRNHDQGRRHRYFPTHCSAFSSALSRFSIKLSDLRASLSNPSFLRPDRAKSSQFWCIFCLEEVVDADSIFACANAISHLASEKHLKSVKDFLWKHGVGSNLDRVDSFRVSEAELTKWEKSCESLKKASIQEGPAKDIQNEITYNSRDNNENIKSINSFSSNVMPLQSATNQKSQDICSNLSGSSSLIGGSQGYNGGEKRAHGEVVNEIGHNEDSKDGIIQNVHTGAPPPWLEPTELLNPKNPNPNSERSKKLNPKRVGAAWAERRRAETERESSGQNASQFGDHWLPNFGRVWQSGTRKDSKKDFEKWKGGSGFNKRKGENIGDLADVAIQIKPYTSKRSRVDLSNEEGKG